MFKILQSNQSLALSNEKMVDSFVDTEGYTFQNIRTLHAFKISEERPPTMAKL
jgi:hypothetical protein